MMYYFCSLKEFEDGTELKPRIPLNRMNNENKTIKRICVSRSIDGCLCAIGGFIEGDIVNVYRIVNELNTFKPTAYLVPDVMFTGEEWITQEVKIKKEFTIKIIKVFKRMHNSINIDLYDYDFIN